MPPTWRLHTENSLGQVKEEEEGLVGQGGTIRRTPKNLRSQRLETGKGDQNHSILHLKCRSEADLGGGVGLRSPGPGWFLRSI